MLQRESGVASQQSLLRGGVHRGSCAGRFDIAACLRRFRRFDPRLHSRRLAGPNCPDQADDATGRLRAAANRQLAGRAAYLRLGRAVAHPCASPASLTERRTRSYAYSCDAAIAATPSTASAVDNRITRSEALIMRHPRPVRTPPTAAIGSPALPPARKNPQPSPEDRHLSTTGPTPPTMGIPSRHR